MSKFSKIARLALVTLGCVVGSHAHAVLVFNTHPFGAVAETFDSYDAFITQGPETMPSGIVFSSDIDSTLGAFAADLGSNGVWGGLSPFAGLGDLSPAPSGTDYLGSLTFTFAAPTYGAGALMNYYGSANSLLFEALGAGGVVLESHNVVISTASSSYNDGLFVGIARSSNDVVAIRLTGDGVVLDDLRLSPQPVPEPETYALVAVGLGLLGLFARRGGKQRAA